MDENFIVDENFVNVLSRFRVTELSYLCKKFSLSPTGRKAVLIDRVKQAFLNLIEGYKEKKVSYLTIYNYFKEIEKMSGGAYTAPPFRHQLSSTGTLNPSSLLILPNSSSSSSSSLFLHTTTSTPSLYNISNLTSVTPTSTSTSTSTSPPPPPLPTTTTTTIPHTSVPIPSVHPSSLPLTSTSPTFQSVPPLNPEGNISHSPSHLNPTTITNLVTNGVLDSPVRVTSQVRVGRKRRRSALEENTNNTNTIIANNNTNKNSPHLVRTFSPSQQQQSPPPPPPQRQQHSQLQQSPQYNLSTATNAMPTTSTLTTPNIQNPLTNLNHPTNVMSPLSSILPPSEFKNAQFILGTNVRIDLSDDPFFEVGQEDPITWFFLESPQTSYRRKNAAWSSCYGLIWREFIINENFYRTIIQKNMRIHLRCFLYKRKNKFFMEDSCSSSHSWPSGCVVIMNDNFVPLIKRDELHKNTIELPADITPFCRIGNNTIKISSSSLLPYVVVIQVMKRVSVEELVLRIQKSRVLDYSTALKRIQDSFRGENEICALKAKLSLQDPLMLTRITIPSRASTCTHIQCFDLKTYLQMNERIRTWLCPICNCQALFKDLIIDGYFQKMLSELNDDEVCEVEIEPSGEWRPVKEKKDSSKESPHYKTYSPHEPASPLSFQPQPQSQPLSSQLSTNRTTMREDEEETIAPPFHPGTFHSNRERTNFFHVVNSANRIVSSPSYSSNNILNNTNAHHSSNNQNNVLLIEQLRRGDSVENAIVLDSDSE